jgi:hypothetical protein
LFLTLYFWPINYYEEIYYNKISANPEIQIIINYDLFKKS